MGRVGTQSPRPPPAAWLSSGRKEVKAAALGWRSEVFPCLLLERTQYSLHLAVLRAALPAPALNLNLVAERMIPTRFLGVEGDNQARPFACLGCSLLQGSS